MNPHERNAHKILSLARLPVPTLPHVLSDSDILSLSIIKIKIIFHFFIIIFYYYLPVARKNNANVPGPACEPITGPISVIREHLLP